MNRNIVLWVLGIAVVALGILQFTLPGRIVTERIVEQLGANPGPDSTHPYSSVSGVRTWSTNNKFKLATTTVCEIKSPSATSTLTFAGARFAVSTTTATVVTMAKAATPWATTTSLGTHSLGANDQVTLLATSTPVDPSDGVTVFAPNQYFVIGMQGGTCVGGNCTYSPTGTCQATFIEM